MTYMRLKKDIVDIILSLFSGNFSDKKTFIDTNNLLL